MARKIDSIFDRILEIQMRTVLIILAVWLLINILFVIVMIPPRKSRKLDRQASGNGYLVPIDGHAQPGADEDFKLRHVIIAIAMGALFSLTPPLLEAFDAVRQFFRKYRR